MQTKKISPSLLSCDFTHLSQELKDLEVAGCDSFHLDVMDGHFVPNLSFGPSFVKAVRKSTKLPLHVHLMIEPVLPFVDAFCSAGADRITFHLEADKHPLRVLDLIHQRGLQGGLALGPATHPKSIEPLCHALDCLVVMTVSPGFGGQTLVPEMLKKVEYIKQGVGRDLFVEIDGGVTPKNCSKAWRAGVDGLVVGEALLSKRYGSYKEVVDHLKSAS